MAEIEDLEVTSEEFARDRVVQWMMGVMPLFQEAANRDFDLLEIRSGLQRLRCKSNGKQSSGSSR